MYLFVFSSSIPFSLSIWEPCLHLVGEGTLDIDPTATTATSVPCRATFPPRPSASPAAAAIQATMATAHPQNVSPSTEQYCSQLIYIMIKGVILEGHIFCAWENMGSPMVSCDRVYGPMGHVYLL